MNKNIKIAKELIKLAKSLVAKDDLENQVNQIIDKSLQSNPEKAIDELSEIIDDKQFDNLVKETTASFKKSFIAYKNDLNENQIKQDIKTWEKFVNKLKKFCSGKPRYIFAAAAALMFSYLQLQVGKVTWLNGLVSTSNHASIDQFLSFLILVVTYFGSVPMVFNIVNQICKNAGYDDFEDLKQSVEK